MSNKGERVRPKDEGGAKEGGHVSFGLAEDEDGRMLDARNVPSKKSGTDMVKENPKAKHIRLLSSLKATPPPDIRIASICITPNGRSFLGGPFYRYRKGLHFRVRYDF